MNKSKWHHSRMFPITCSCDYKQNYTFLLPKLMRITGVSLLSLTLVWKDALLALCFTYSLCFMSLLLTANSWPPL